MNEFLRLLGMSEKNTSRSSRRTGRVGLAAGFLVVFGSALGAVLFLTSTVLFFADPMGDIVKSAYGWILNTKKTELSDYEREYIKKLIDDGYILSPDLFLSEIISFYSNVISYLFGLMGIMGFAGFFYIKAASKNEAEDLAEEAAQREFKTGAFRDLVKGELVNIIKDSDAIDSYFDDVIGRIEVMESALDPSQLATTTAIRGEIAVLREQITNIMGKLSKKDDAEDLGGALEISDDHIDEPQDN